MPTPESADAFKKLAAARDHLNEVTKELNDAHAKMLEHSSGRAHHVQLQKDWVDAFEKFEAATKELAEVLRNLRREIESGSAT